MEADRIRLELDPSRSRLHPSNLLASAINGIAAMEEFRQGNAPEPGSSPRVERMREANQKREEEFVEWRSDVLGLAAMQSRATEDPERFKKPYLAKLEGYHNKRAGNLGAHITALEVRKPKFVRIRKWVAEKKQTYHIKRSQKAARQLIEFALA